MRFQDSSAHEDSSSLKALVESISGPAYRRLLAAEPTLRRGVPILVAAFVCTIVLGGVVQVLEQRRAVIEEVKHRIVAVSRLVANQLNAADPNSADASRRAQDELSRLSSYELLQSKQTALITDKSGTIIAVLPITQTFAKQNLVDLLGSTKSMNENSNATSIHLADNSEFLVATQDLTAPYGRVFVMESRAAALSEWYGASALTMTLTMTTSFVVLILGFAFHWQASRAREADRIYASVRDRIEAALNSGRCGLWDWDLTSLKDFLVSFHVRSPWSASKKRFADNR